MQTSHVIAEMLDHSRKFNLFYLLKVDPARATERYMFEGRQKNSAHWIMGHLIWAELGIIHESCGGPNMDLPWLKQFRIGGNSPATFQGPDFHELLIEMGRVHDHCLDYIRSLSDEDLEAPAFVAPANWNTVRRKALYHGIRHESFHTGQLSWIAQAHGAALP